MTWGVDERGKEKGDRRALGLAENIIILWILRLETWELKAIVCNSLFLF